MLRSRVSSSIDTARLSNAVSRPGIDPRVWVSYAVLISEPYLEARDGQQDIVVDLQLMPTGEEETARVGAIYAGNGFGLYAPLHEGDEVLVCAPSGDPDEGLVVMQRLWSPADPPPQEVYDNPEDVTLVVQPGKNLRLKTLGSGTTYITADTGKVVLGDEDASKGVARVDDTVQITLTPVDVAALILTCAAVPGPVVGAGTITVTGKITSGATKVVAS